MGGIGAAFWLYAALALMLCAAAITVLRAKPSAANALYAVMALCQAGNLVCMAIDATTLASLFDHERLDFPLRRAFDLATLAAAVHLSCTHPRRLRAAAWLPAAAWSFASLTWLAVHFSDAGAGGWWVTQAALLTMGCVAVGLMHLSFQSHPHPFALVMKRFSVVVGGTWILVQAAVILMRQPDVATPLSSTSLPLAIVVWQVLFALVLASVPFLSKSRSMVRELSLFAIIGTLAVVLDLLFVSVFALQHFAALTLALFLSMAVYAGARQWLVNRMLGTRVASTERLFEQLFRTTREVETHPEQAGPALSRLLKELFDPFEVTLLDKPVSSAHTLSDGSAMRVPVPVIAGASAPSASASILLRHAQQGRRLFTRDDVRLAERIGEQLKRTVAFDQAVEQGRSEERRRLAQDLHDDIGARLLTLMYKAQSPEMEDYARHTLQDLKTLTRGLAASNQPLAHALAEWKADIAQRLTAAHIALKWTATQDADVVLSVVQWSGLTRVLRELVTNVIAHAQARSIEIDVSLVSDRLVITVTDDGIGQAPEQWAPGLGVGGVRKRVRQLGGEVSWQEHLPQGICCRVSVERLAASG
jgi:signal transduction histidine kinase